MSSRRARTTRQATRRSRPRRHHPGLFTRVHSVCGRRCRGLPSWAGFTYRGRLDLWPGVVGSAAFGAVAQLVAHHTGSVGVRGSSPLSSTRESAGHRACRTGFPALLGRPRRGRARHVPDPSRAADNCRVRVFWRPFPARPGRAVEIGRVTKRSARSARPRRAMPPTRPVRRSAHAPASRSRRSGAIGGFRACAEVRPRWHPHPSAETIRASPYRDEIEYDGRTCSATSSQSVAALRRLLGKPGRGVRVAGEPHAGGYAAVERVALDPACMPPQAITSWRRGFPLELIRYAGANRLKVDIDYRAETVAGVPGGSSRTPCAAPWTATFCCSWSTIGASSAATGSIGSPEPGRPRKRSGRVSWWSSK